MQIPREAQAVRLVQERLAELVDVPVSKTRLRTRLRLPDGGLVDAVVQVGPHTFAIECKSAGTAGPVAMAVEQVRRQCESVAS